MKFAFFGSSEFSIHVLNAMEAAGATPSLVVTTPDKPQGRGLTLTPNTVKVWATGRNIPVLDPAKLDDAFIGSLTIDHWDVFIVASYGKIIPEKILDIPGRKTLNVHPSLLPNYRGASPIQSAMLDDAKDTGVSIMRLDKEMDHGPILGQEKVHLDEWPTYEEAEAKLAEVGGRLMAQILPTWVAGEIKETEQNHAAATFTKKILKEDAELTEQELFAPTSRDQAYLAFRKIQAYHTWPVAYFFGQKDGKKLRTKITAANWDGKKQKLVIEKVIPEGKKEIPFADYAYLPK